MTSGSWTLTPDLAFASFFTRSTVGRVTGFDEVPLVNFWVPEADASLEAEGEGKREYGAMHLRKYSKEANTVNDNSTAQYSINWAGFSKC